MRRALGSTLMLLTLSTAFAQDRPDDADPPADPSATPYAWGGLALPLVNVNTTDGLGFGVGAELYNRRREQNFGYKYRISISTFWTTSGNYTSNYVQIEHRDEHFWTVRLLYRGWKNMLYAGSGGADIIRLLPREEAGNNVVYGPILLANIVRRVRNSPVMLFGQAYARYAAVRANPGGLLERERPFGWEGGAYFDLGGGAWMQEVDRWPLPTKGYEIELGIRAGGTGAPGGFRGLFGVHAEAKGWLPIAGQWLTLNARTVFDKSWGERPFWDQENLAGIARDENGYEQMMVGYGRSRTRGDGVFATMVELRPYFGRAQAGFFDLSFGLSVFAETAFLFRKNDLGPHMPSVGVSPILLWQGAIPLRPFIAWGWRSENGGKRRPESQFGISLTGVL